MSEFMINKARTVALTGHRVLLKDFNSEKLKELFLKLIEIGYDTFLNGMAIGFDTECFKVLLQIKKEKPIKIIACIPCLNQSEKFNEKQKKEYDILLESADGKVLISEKYTSTCMQKRNKYMVDFSSVLVAYLKRDFGGTSSTVKYAKKQNVRIIYID